MPYLCSGDENRRLHIPLPTLPRPQPHPCRSRRHRPARENAHPAPRTTLARRRPSRSRHPRHPLRLRRIPPQTLQPRERHPHHDPEQRDVSLHRPALKDPRRADLRRHRSPARKHPWPPYDTALLFDIRDYGVCSPARKNNDFRRVATAVFPVISSNPNSLLILHARADIPHLHRWPGLKEYTDPSFSPHPPSESKAYGATLSRASTESKALGAMASRPSSESTAHGTTISRSSPETDNLPILIPLKIDPPPRPR